MLSTLDIIDLYDKQEYDTIIDILGIRSNHSKSQKILVYAISTSNIELFAHTFTTHNITPSIIAEIMECKLLYPKFKYMIDNDNILHDTIRNIINTNKLPLWNKQYYNIIRYISDIDHSRLIEFFDKALFQNNITIIDDLFVYGLDIKLAFDETMKQIFTTQVTSIYVSTLIFLEKYNIDIGLYLDKISMAYCFGNNLDGIKFCLKYGANINDLLKLSVSYSTTVITVKYLIEAGAEVSYLNMQSHEYRCNLDVISYLVDNGFDITNYLSRFIFKAIYTEDLHHLKYFMNYHNSCAHLELFLFFAVGCCHNDIVKFLLDTITPPDNILLFSKSELKNEIEKMIPDYDNYFVFNAISSDKKISMFKFLMKSGIPITNPVKTMQTYLSYSDAYIDEEFLGYFLDVGFDLNAKCVYVVFEYNGSRRMGSKNKWNITREFGSILTYFIFYGRVDEVTLLLKYGADPNYNNYEPIKLAIECESNTQYAIYSAIVQKLLDHATNTPELNDLIEKYNINNNTNSDDDESY